MIKGKWTDKVQASDFDRMVVRGLSAIGPFLEGEVIVRTPVKWGRLRGSYTYAIKKEQDEIRPDKNGIRWPEDKIDKPTDKYTLYVGTNCNYGPHVEYGTRNMAAQPHARPALDRNRKRCGEIFQKEIKKVLRGQ